MSLGYEDIPKEIDLLISHGPPKGFGSYTKFGRDIGCIELLTHVQRVKPTIHLFGHVHDAYGVSTDDYTTYINTALLGINRCIVFDLLPAKIGYKIESPYEKIDTGKET